MTGRVLAVSDLHVGYARNRDLVERLLVPSDPDDWLLVAGDVGERLADVARTLALLAGRFRTVVWVPGNHELWTHPADPVTLRGTARYDRLVDVCRELGVLTPEDPYPTWTGDGEPVLVAPLFLLYDYTFRTDGALGRDEAVAAARAAGIVANDERFLHPDPYPRADEWCAARVASTRTRLDEVAARGTRMLLVNHWPTHRHPTEVLRFPPFALWCGTVSSADWHVRYPVAGVVYGHLHVPRVTEQDGVPFTEVSLGYPREWERRAAGPQLARPVWPPPS